MERARAHVIAALAAAGLLATTAVSEAGLLERWRAARSARFSRESGIERAEYRADAALERAQAPQPPAVSPAPAQPGASQPVPSGPRPGALSVEPEPFPPAVLPEPFSARGGALGVGAGTSGAMAAEDGPGAGAARPAASLPHDVIVEVPTGPCTKKQVVVHCRGCAPGRCRKVWGCLPDCVTCQMRTFRVTNPMNGCPVDVTTCLPAAPEKARRVEKEPYYITYHFDDCRVTFWFLFERNNDYLVHYAPEGPQ